MCLSKHVLRVLACLLVSLAAGCGSYNAKTQKTTGDASLNQWSVAAQRAQNKSNDCAGRDKLVFLLEAGATLRAAGDLPGSTQAFETADGLFDTYDQKANVQISREAMSVILNQASVDYEGYGYDRIMMNLYKAMNYLERGEMDNARAEFKRVAEGQDRIKKRYEKKIAQAEKAAAQKDEKNDFDVRQAQEDPSFKKQLEDNYADLKDLPDLKPEAIYANPAAEYLQGLFFLYAGDRSDQEVGRVAIRNAAGMAPANPYLKDDAVLAEQIAKGGAIPPMTYVIFETGMAPRREEFRVESCWISKGTVVRFSAAFPRLRTQPNNHPDLFVGTATGSRQAADLADMDRIIAQEFRNELPEVITRTLISASIRAAATASKETGKRNLGDDILDLGKGIWNHEASKADLRTWATLPKRIQIASFPTPEDRKLSLTYSNQQPPVAVQLIPAMVNVVHVRTGGWGGTPVVRQFKLK